jgi:trans-aconitate methyltransferase
LSFLDIQCNVFNGAAELYDKIRPGYPDEIIEEVLSFASMTSDSRILEIGCGTGQLTAPLAKRGFSITALDRGSALVEIARKNCRQFPNAKIINSAFEDWNNDDSEFDLFVSAQAFHWIDPKYGIKRAAELLNNNGAIALIWNTQRRSETTEFWQATNPIYEKYNPVTSAKPHPLEWSIDQYRRELESSDQFENPIEFSKQWSIMYSHDEYIMLLNTYSDHITIPEPQKSAFFGEISDVIMKMGGEVERLYETLTIVARVRR